MRMLSHRDRVKFFASGLLVIALLGTPFYSWAQSAPFPASTVITGVNWDLSSIQSEASGSDNWVITWAEDNHQYTSWGDGGGFGGTNSDGRVSMGVGRVEGSKDSYQGFNVWGGKNPENPATFAGKAYGILSIGGVLYMWRTGDGSEGSAFTLQEVYQSTNHGASWQYAGVRFTQSDFPGSKGFFAPTFLNFGKDYQGARDSYVYSYAPENQNDNWNVQKPGKITLMRVLQSQIIQKNAYEYFAGTDGGGVPIWTSTIANRVPVFEDSGNGVMRTSVSYNPGLGRYILMTQQIDRYSSGNGHMGIYDAPEPWGPWTTVLFANHWSLGIQNGNKTVYWNFSNKWLSENGENFVMVYTGPGGDSWGTIEGSFTVGNPDTTPPDQPINLQFSP